MAAIADHDAYERLAPFIKGARSTLDFYINGIKIELSNPDPEHTLLDFLRSQPGLKGTKLGCGEGGCGACTCVIQTYEGNRLRHLAVNACLFPLVGVVGKHVITIEGLGDVDNPHPLQERIAKLHGSQCGFCTPGIVMSLYALVRNAYDPRTKCFHLSESDIELEGHLDGNLCRCTGYKPILRAAKTFITEDLKGQLIFKTVSKCDISSQDEDQNDILYRSETAKSGGKPFSCGRPGGCCRDVNIPAAGLGMNSLPNISPSDESGDSLESDLTSPSSSIESLGSNTKAPTVGASYGKPMKSRQKAKTRELVEGSQKTSVSLDTLVSNESRKVPIYNFKSYSPRTELLFPTALRKFTQELVFYGDSKRLWLRPVTLQQLIEVKNAYPSAKIVSGSSEVQVEVRFKTSPYPVSVYVSDIDQLRGIDIPSDDVALATMSEFVIGANASLTDIEDSCRLIYSKLGRRAQVLEAVRKQLRYFAGRQIRNVASLAGNIATASPISDLNPVLLAAGATLACMNVAKGDFILPLASFFIKYRTTTLPADAVITQVRIPLAPLDAMQVTKAYKQAKRKDDDIAIVTAGFSVRLSTAGLVESVRLSYGGMADKTVEALNAINYLLGKKWYDAKTLDEAMSCLARDFSLQYGVIGGMATYRRTLAMSLFFRFWHEVASDLQLGEVDPDLIREIHRGTSSGSRDEFNPFEQRVVGKQIPHLSSLKQTTGEAQYIDDIPRQDRELFGALVLSAKAHAKILSVDWSPAIGPDLALGYVDKNDISKEANLWGSIVKDEQFFADGEVFSHGQPIGLVYAATALKAQAAARLVSVKYEDLPVILTIEEAIAANSFFTFGKELKKGAAVDEKMSQIWATCDRVFEGTSRIGGQEHFYLETNASLVIPSREDGTMEVWSSTQNTMEIQEFVSQVTGVPSNRINARVRRMGGAFGGKESRAVQLAAILAVAAKKTKRPMRAMLNRDEDMITTGQRHPFQARWKVGTTHDGLLIALDADVYDNAGFSSDMSGAVMGRCMTHLENCYEIPHAHVRGHVCKSHIHSNTAFRGFGGPQAMFITESFMYAIAEGLNISVDELRMKNLYKEGDLTLFLQKIDSDWHVPLLLDQVRQEVEYEKRKAEIVEFNAKNRWKKRGICLIPTKFGLSFATALHLNQASANVMIYADGSIMLQHGGTEMGQGLYTKMAQIASQELGVPIDAIFTPDTTTYQTANASPTAASSGSDLNGMAVKDACDQLNERLKPIRLLHGSDAPMKTIAHAAYLARIDLSAHGFWKMPKIGFQWGNYNPKTVQPMYYYFTQGVASSEVELDILTGDHTVLRTDIKMDIGRSINPAIDYGQIEGAFIQGQGLFTIEESLWFQDGQLATRGPGTYKIPGFSDIPQEFNVSFLQDVPGSWKSLRSIQSSKGVGEPPLFLGATVLFALREALKSAREDNGVTDKLVLDSPATAERLRLLVGDELLRRGTVVPKEGEKNFFVKVE